MSVYGLVGISLPMQSLVSIFDFGLSATISRELARRTGHPSDGATISDLARTLETVYWAFTLTVGAVLWISAEWLSLHWFKVSSDVSAQELTTALRYGIVAVVFQLPVGFYSSGLVGLQRQILNNIVYVACSALKLLGGVTVAIVTTGDAISFFAWQLFAS